jgi:hypothetical protein
MVNDTGVDEIDDMEIVGDTITKKEVDGKEVVEEFNSDAIDMGEECNSDEGCTSGLE